KQRLIGYGGSQSIQSPKSLYKDAAKQLLDDLKIEVARFETAFDEKFYALLGLSHGVFFARETFGRDALVTGDPVNTNAEEIERRMPNAKSFAEFVSGFPISDASKAQLIALTDRTHDPLAGKTLEQKQDILKRTSYRDFLMKIRGCSAEAANCYQ